MISLASSAMCPGAWKRREIIARRAGFREPICPKSQRLTGFPGTLPEGGFHAGAVGVFDDPFFGHEGIDELVRGDVEDGVPGADVGGGGTDGDDAEELRGVALLDVNPVSLRWRDSDAE